MIHPKKIIEQCGLRIVKSSDDFSYTTTTLRGTTSRRGQIVHRTSSTSPPKHPHSMLQKRFFSAAFPGPIFSLLCSVQPILRAPVVGTGCGAVNDSFVELSSLWLRRPDPDALFPLLCDLSAIAELFDSAGEFTKGELDLCSLL